MACPAFCHLQYENVQEGLEWLIIQMRMNVREIVNCAHACSCTINSIFSSCFREPGNEASTLTNGKICGWDQFSIHGAIHIYRLLLNFFDQMLLIFLLLIFVRLLFEGSNNSRAATTIRRQQLFEGGIYMKKYGTWLSEHAYYLPNIYGLLWNFAPVAHGDLW